MNRQRRRRADEVKEERTRAMAANPYDYALDPTDYEISNLASGQKPLQVSIYNLKVSGIEF